jgi:hypothetical protein
MASGGVGAIAACSCDSNDPGAKDGGASDGAGADAAGGIDAPLGPVFCGLPMPSICPMTAACTWSALGCSLPACDGYFVVTDGTWVDYYSAAGGALAGEVAGGDAGIVSCPYGFIPPVGCTPTPLAQCTTSGDGGEHGGEDGGDAAVVTDASPDGSADTGLQDASVTDGPADASAPDAD